jgi:glycosyltransferase involved in cell wall biosynthesis
VTGPAQNPRIALVHDYLLTMRGAERAFATIASLWPQAPIYTLLYDSERMDGHFASHPVHTSWLQRLGVRQENFRRLLPLYPRAVERLPTRGYDLVISSSSAFAHGVPVADGAEHICYCYTPFRYAWHDYAMALEEAPRQLRPFLRGTLKRVRDWDIEASRRVTHYIAISQLSQQRIAEFWGRDAPVVHPPVAVDRFQIGEPQDYFLVVAQLVRHKRIEIALQAARRAGKRIKVVGSGPERDRLQKAYGDRAEFLGRVSDLELAALYAGALALVVPNIEEFGIAAVEAQAAGRPVIAADAGGARETVIDGQTGVMVPPESVDAFAEAMTAVDFTAFSPIQIRTSALRFSEAQFERRFLRELARLTQSNPGDNGPRSSSSGGPSTLTTRWSTSSTSPTKP